MAEFLLPVPRTVLLKMLRSESRETGFSDSAVRVSLLLDIDAGRLPSQREAARLWGWTYKQVRYHWEDIWKDVAAWCAWNGDGADDRLIQKLPEAWQGYATQTRKNKGRTLGAVGAQSGAHKTPIRGSPGGLGAHEGRNKGAVGAQHTIQKQKTNSLSNERECETRARGLPFDDFWEAYGKKIDRKKCESKWARIPDDLKPEIIAHVERYVETTPEIRYRKNPLTYLNGECWNDELPGAFARNGSKPGGKMVPAPATNGQVAGSGAGNHGSVTGGDRRYTSTERASQTTIRGNLDLVRSMRERRERSDSGNESRIAHEACDDQ